MGLSQLRLPFRHTSIVRVPELLDRCDANHGLDNHCLYHSATPACWAFTLEQEAGLEPTNACLIYRRGYSVLHQRIELCITSLSDLPRLPAESWSILAGHEGIEPSQSDLESNPLPSRMTYEWRMSESNRRPSACHADALPTELRPRSYQSSLAALPSLLPALRTEEATFLTDSGTEGIRTLYLCCAKAALSQVSYSPITCSSHTQASALGYPLHTTNQDNLCKE